MYRILFLFCLLVACNNHKHQPAANRPATTSNSASKLDRLALYNVSTDSAINYIRHTFQEINATSLKHRTFEWTAINCGEGTVTYYLTPNNEIAKVVESGAIGDGSWTIAYYYQNGIFLFSLETNIGGPAIGPVDTFTVRKYAYADNVIRTLRDKADTTPPDSVLTPASKEYRILEAYKSKNFSAALCNE